MFYLLKYRQKIKKGFFCNFWGLCIVFGFFVFVRERGLGGVPRFLDFWIFVSVRGLGGVPLHYPKGVRGFPPA